MVCGDGGGGGDEQGDVIRLEIMPCPPKPAHATFRIIGLFRHFSGEEYLRSTTTHIFLTVLNRKCM